MTDAGALQLRPRREGGFHRGRRGRASGTKLARFERATPRSSCQGPEVRCVGHLWRSICCAAEFLGPGSCRGSSGLDSPRLPWTEVMGDSKEAGAEAPPAGAAARGGLSLLSQGESEEPAQVSRPRGGTSGLRSCGPVPQGRDVTVPGGFPSLLHASPAAPQNERTSLCLLPGS